MNKASQKLSEKIIFKNESWPFDTKGGDCLFNEAFYLKNCIPDKKELFRFSMWRSKKELIAINYIISDNNVKVGAHSSFAFPEASPNIAFHHVQEFIEAFLLEMQSQKAEAISWKHFPNIFGARLGANMNQALLNFGFVVESNSLNHHLSLKKDFNDSLSEDAQRRLIKAIKKNIHVKIENNFNVEDYYTHLSHWRKAKKRSISVSLSTLKELCDSLPDHYHLFTAEFLDQPIAMCLAVRISPKVLYYFLPDQDPDFDDLSPSIIVLNSMHQYARKHKYKFLDLGISTYPGKEENLGLIRFKEKIGGVPSVKIHYFKRLR